MKDFTTQHSSQAAKLDSSYLAQQRSISPLSKQLEPLLIQLDQATLKHSKRVGDYAERFAHYIGLSPKEARLLQLAGYVHDIGKLRVTTNLEKQGLLSSTEWLDVKKHPRYGFELLEGVLNNAQYMDILNITLEHHERWDGQGYPQNLSKDAIHPFARIISVIDSFDALTTYRPYRKALSWSKALLEIEAHANSQYDPEVTRLFIESIHQEAMLAAS